MRIEKTLLEWRSTCGYLKCKWCGASLADAKVDHYPHENGWYVTGYTKRQWLSLHCPSCGYDWSLWKLQTPDEIAAQLRAEQEFTRTGNKEVEL